MSDSVPDGASASENADLTQAQLATHLADNLRSIREGMALTQVALAQLCSVPRSTIANIETGTSNPTLSVLSKLSAALSVSLESLISPPRGGVQHFPASQVRTVKRGKAVINKLLPHPIAGMEIDRIRLRPGARLVGVPHHSGTQEYLYCESGALVLWTDGQRVAIEAGDVAAFPGDQKHSYLNDGNEDAIAFSVVTAQS